MRTEDQYQSRIVTHPIHASLYRPVLFLGVEQPVAILEATLVFALLVGVGLHVMTIVLGIVIISVIHPVMARLTTHDPDVTRVYLRSLGAADYYPAHSALMASARPVRPALPATP
jgi:type IV secretory pathway TrbD component